MSVRVALFIDYQNVYKGARAAFEGANVLSSRGQIDPFKLGHLICERRQPGGQRELCDVRVYIGQPSSSKDPRGYGAQRRQISRWEASSVQVFPRPLRYSPGYPSVKPEEKGIDVSLAVDFVAGAVDGAFDVGIIFSTDTDLKPALEFVAQATATRSDARSGCVVGNVEHERPSQSRGPSNVVSPPVSSRLRPGAGSDGLRRPAIRTSSPRRVAFNVASRCQIRPSNSHALWQI